MKKAMADEPPSIAVALSYDLGQGVPRVVATGRGHIAHQIVERAIEVEVPVECDSAIAGALAQLEIDQAIPPELYRAVAHVIGFLMRKGRLR